MKKILSEFIAFVILVCIFFTAQSQDRHLPDKVRMPAHPRVLLLKGEEASIRAAIASDPVWKKMHETIRMYCDAVIDSAALERIPPSGPLMNTLNTSRKALRRIFYLSYVYRVTGEDKYAQRAKKELMAVCNFSDWNPPHFLDAAEMTTAVSIGYDWLYDKLSDDERKLMEESIVKKGIQPSFDKQFNWFLDSGSNWNQVCNTGMSYGALAVWDQEQQLSRQVINRALNSIHLPMEQYKPNGAYPEGYGYWNYGTSYNVMFLSAIESVFHDDFGLSKLPGFMKTPGFMENMTGNSGLCFNWADCLLTGTIKPTMFWFAKRNNDPSVLWMEKKYLMESDYSRFTRERLLPTIMIWGKDIRLNQVTAPKTKVWIGEGASPVVAMRTSWTGDGIYLGFKAGTPSSGHGHMDVGSFVMESDGVRWASDLGMQNYETLESRGMDIWGRTQDATRWTVFRMSSYSHNILTVDSMQQRVNGFASIERFSDKPEFSYAISDLTAVYDGQLASAKRGVGIRNGKYVVVHDEYTATDKPVTVRWVMLTAADVKITGANTAELTKDGKKLALKVVSSKGVQLKTWSTAPTNDYDAPNPGTVMIGFETKVSANERISQSVLLLPGGQEQSVRPVQKLEAWK
jgi:hypothetical protein